MVLGRLTLDLIDDAPEYIPKVTYKRNYEHGDARYLQMALAVLQAKNKLLGLDEPKKPVDPRLGGMEELPPGSSAAVTFIERMMKIKFNVTASAPTTDPIPPVGPTPIEADFSPQPEPEAESAASDNPQDGT